ncbi:hypothetical protein C672_1680 [[Clostridium] bifermentans ATCC 638]|uniref:Uncharacterized protein n=1 Tax=Paraclostridium bifermentans ATCC 638 = DSM 14991 TaxID=1233171 RepID=T4VPQ2_PARBF|nr:hypothetical protein [Paraclostridium bifermentans]EQK42736.1 hypothetical protein C672_1680 [[Clostridium] bifermentans ATCC 638] [Paraclostridium bifermentans ATCC 638 = DSM 14991]RIZ58419.1 hypothetical protein CHH45_11370 [Paraclostridium bifermentans]UAG19536.1 hypothetical protein KXZ80_07455 [Paraclostridium bifermentans]
MNELVRVDNKEISKCREAQKEYALKNGAPYFAPSDGVCWKCNRNIYQNYEICDFDGIYIYKQISDGYSLNRASSELITGCPHCSRSYCD